MLGIYPLRPVVSAEARWKAAYDASPASINLTSEWMSPSEARALLAAGAAFEAVVLLNGAGDDLVEALRAAGKTRVQRMRIDGDSREFAGIHEQLKEPARRGVFQMAGG
jgi:hypothetical protein